MTDAIARWAPSSRMVAAVGFLVGVVLGTPTGALAGPTARVSVDSDGAQVDAGSDLAGYNFNFGSREVSISADGRFVAFVSAATDLVPRDTNMWPDVFVHDRQTGATERVSVSSTGAQGNDASFWPAISADGRFVAFLSNATSLVPGDANGVTDVFVHDRQTRHTERVSVDSAGTEANGPSSGPSISASGRFVAFQSTANNLVPGDTNGVTDVFVFDRSTGSIERVSVDDAGTEGTGESSGPAISADGRFVAFWSWATNLVPGDTNGIYDVFVHDRQTRTTERVSVDSAGAQAAGGSLSPSISADGRVVAFVSWATNLVPGDTSVVTDVFVHDRQTGSTERVSVDSAGTEGNNQSDQPSISGDGRFVAFSSRATNFVPGDTNQISDVFVHDGQTRITERVSVDGDGNQANGGSRAPSISADGRFVAFSSEASNLVPGDTNNAADTFVHDRAVTPDTSPPVHTNPQPSGRLPAGTTQARLRLTTNDDATCRYSTTPGVAYEAMTAIFATTGGTAHATSVGGLSDGESYIFYVRCQDTAGNANTDDYLIAFSVTTASAGGSTELVSVDSSGNPADNYVSSLPPAISADGRFVAFASPAGNLVPGDLHGQDDVFVHDRHTRTTERVSVDSGGNEGDSSSGEPALSADGRFVAFQSSARNLVPGDTNGRLDVFVRDRWTGTTERVSVDSAGTQGDGDSYTPALSADGRFVAFFSLATNLVPGDNNGTYDVFVHDRQTRSTERVSVDSAGTQGNDTSGYPSLSADGRVVVFTSRASNLVPGDTNGMYDVFVHDRQTGSTERVSGTQGDEGFHRSALSADGRFVAFTSRASDLVPGDTNGTYDVFVHDRQTRSTERVSVDSAGAQARRFTASISPSISADGRFVAFASTAADLVPGDTNGHWDVFVHDRQTRITERVSVDGTGTERNHDSLAPAINADGRFVAFMSWASFVPEATTCSVYVHHRAPTTPADATTTVNFDSPPPPGPPGPLHGVFQGIDFGAGRWSWEGSYNAFATNHIFFSDSTGTSRTFTFSPAPRILEAMSVFGLTTGTLTLADDTGQTLTREVTTESMQLVTTGWTQPSTTVTVSFTNGWELGVDDITHRQAP